MDLDQVAGYPRAYIDSVRRFQAAGKFIELLDLPLDDRRHRDGGRTSGLFGGIFLGAASDEKRQDGKGDKTCCQRIHSSNLPNCVAQRGNRFLQRNTYGELIGK